MFPHDVIVGFETGLAAIVSWEVGGLLVRSLLRLFQLDARLPGRWEGELFCDERPDLNSHGIRCTLVLARPRTRPNSGLLYYDRQCCVQGLCIARGVDELQTYKRAFWTLPPAKFTMVFTRRFHYDYVKKLVYALEPYTFSCKFGRVLRGSPTMDVEVELKAGELSGRLSDTWKGVFTKI